MGGGKGGLVSSIDQQQPVAQAATCCSGDTQLQSEAGCVHAEMAAAEMQLLRQALDKLQSETQVLDDELARAREQAIFSELEHAELSNDLELVTAQLQACEASKAELESTISKVMLQGFRVALSVYVILYGLSISRDVATCEGRQLPLSVVT